MTQLEIANKWFEAFNAQNIEMLLSLYDDNAEHFSPRLLKNNPDTKGIIKGKTEMNKWWQGAFNKMPSLRYYPLEISEEGDKVLLKYNRCVETDEDQIINESLQIKNELIVFSKVII